MWEFPMAAQKWMLSLGHDSHEVEEALLKACQAWTNLANQSMERVFQAQGFVGPMTGSVKHLVQCQRVARDFLESLVPGSGTYKTSEGAAEIAELRESVIRLRQEVRGLKARVNLMDRRETVAAELR